MSAYRRALRGALAAERQAYGFALVMWGSATLVSSVRGPARATDVVAFVGGALVAMSTILVGSITSDEPGTSPSDRMSWGAIHVASVATALVGAWAIATVVTAGALAYLLAGAFATAAYQLVLALEVTVLGPTRRSTGPSDGRTDGDRS